MNHSCFVRGSSRQILGVQGTSPMPTVGTRLGMRVAVVLVRHARITLTSRLEGLHAPRGHHRSDRGAAARRAYEDRPPCYPTVGRFGPGRMYEVNPGGFDVDKDFEML